MVIKETIHQEAIVNVYVPKNRLQNTQRKTNRYDKTERKNKHTIIVEISTLLSQDLIK